MKKFGNAFLHIGFDKTGSKAIQVALDKSRNFLLKEGGIAYLPGTWHAELGSYFCRKPEHFILNQTSFIDHREAINTRDSAYIKTVVDWLDTIESGKSLVISYEGFPAMDVKSLKDLKDFILTYTNKINVIAYTRPPLSYTASAMSQRVRMGRTAFLPGTPPIIPVKLIVSEFSRVFDIENIYIHPYDRSLLIEEDIVTDFLARFLKTSRSITRRCANKSTENPGLSHDAVMYGNYLIDAAKKHSMTGLLNTSEFNETFTKYLRALPGGKVKLTGEQIDEVLDQSRINNEFLEHEFGIKFQESRSDYLIGEEQKYTRETENLLRSIAEINILMERDRPPRPGRVHQDKRKTILVRLKQLLNKFTDTHVKD